MLEDFSVALQCVSHQMQNPLQGRWVFKTPQLFGHNSASRPQFPYNSSTVLTHYTTSALAKIQALEQLEA